MPSLTLPALIHFASAALGALLALLLLSRRRGNSQANRWLAAFVGCLALLWTGDLLEETRSVLTWPWASHTTDWLIFLVGPCLWMYVRRLTRLQTPGFRVWLIHAAPAFLILALLVPFYRLPAPAKVEVIARELAQPDDSLNLPLLAAVLQSMGYSVASLVRVRRFHMGLRERYSSLAKRNLTWLHTMLSVTLAMWILWAIAIIVHAPWSQWLAHIAIPPGLYLLAFFGLRQPAPFADSYEGDRLRIRYFPVCAFGSRSRAGASIPVAARCGDESGKTLARERSHARRPGAAIRAPLSGRAEPTRACHFPIESRSSRSDGPAERAVIFLSGPCTAVSRSPSLVMNESGLCRANN